MLLVVFFIWEFKKESAIDRNDFSSLVNREIISVFCSFLFKLQKNKYDQYQVVKCEKIVGNVDSYVPFKVTVKASDRDKLLNPDIWPCNVFVRKFRRPRQQNGTFRQTDSR